MAGVMVDGYNADVNASNLVGETPLFVSSLKGHVTVVQVLIDNVSHPWAGIHCDFIFSIYSSTSSRSKCIESIYLPFVYIVFHYVYGDMLFTCQDQFIAGV